MTTQKKYPSVLFILGPTASGKTNLSEDLARALDGEIINIDVGQFYKPLTIGTAKPQWQKYPFKAHLFDILDDPTDLNVRTYREYVLDLVDQIAARGHVPIIIGGSFFYVKSLFFPPHEFSFSSAPVIESFSDKNLWDELYKVDPVRAQELHPHDEYRIKRALTIWQTTGKQASQLKPIFDPQVRPLFLYISRDRSNINNRIRMRTEIMINNQGWIDEAEQLIGSAWEQFLVEKNLIGYSILFDWIKTSKQIHRLPEVIERITIQTRQYAKRQETFWRGFVQLLSQQTKPSGWDYKILEIHNSESEDSKAIYSFFKILDR